MIGFIAFVAAFIIHHVGRPIRHPIDYPLLFRKFPQIVPLMFISVGACWLVVLWSVLSYAYYEMNFDQITTLFFVSIFWCISVILIAPTIIPFLAKIYSGNGRLAEWGAFFSGAALGPISFLAMFNALDIARGLAGARLWGAIAGTLSIYSLYGYFADSSPSPPSRQSVQQQQPVIPRQPSSPVITPAPTPPAPPGPTLEGVTVRTETFGDWSFQERRDSAGNKICLIQPTNLPTSAAQTLGIGWSARNQTVSLFLNSDGAPASIMHASIDNQNFNLRYDYSLTLRSDLRRHHYIFPVVMIDAFSSGNVLTANGVRYSLRGSFRAYGALAACINARP